MTPEACRLLQACEMHDLGVRMKLEALRREHPNADPAEVRRLLREWLNELRYDLEPDVRVVRDPARFREPA